MSAIKYSHTLWSPSDTVKDVAEILGIANLPDEVAKTLAMDIEYRIHEIVEQALKFMRHSKRTTLTTSDIGYALRVLNVEPLYGYEAQRPLSYREAMVGPGQTLYYIDEDEEVDFEKIINQPLPKVPREVSFTAHWLAIEGVQPAIPQNPHMSEIKAMPAQIRGSQTGHSLAAMASDVEVKPLVRHVISKELQLYFDRVIAAVLGTTSTGSASITSTTAANGPSPTDLRASALSSLRNDPGLHQLVPYFVQFVQEKVSQNLKTNLDVLSSMLDIVHSLLSNPTIFIEPYIHHLMPSVLTPLLAKQCGPKPITAESYQVRDYAASLLKLICDTYGDTYHTLKPRVTRTLLKGFMDTTRPACALYGSVVGLKALGAEIVRVVILGNIKAWYQGVFPRISKEEDRKTLLRGVIDALRSLKTEAPQIPDETTIDEPALIAKLGEELATKISQEADGKEIAYAVLYGDI
ncbi:Taf6p [Sugiyamaella lignohabitans]|uniref:TBP-associated factor 6 n=1 Tax=Sugiyamaella lignohabitans TaxID=796027 RepID=A0A167DMW1_9ASCO|nr:Taf6p [Sugiyamaella lignohabitans]ANB13085.1 Taf6p [Sugiyamaella lignohabitans]